MSPFGPSFPPQPRVFPQPFDFAGPLFSYCYKSLFPQPLYSHIHPKPQGVSLSSIQHPAASHISPLLLITSLQTQYFHAIAHSFAQRHSSNHRIINRLRILSIVTGVVPPGVPPKSRPDPDGESSWQANLPRLQLAVHSSSGPLAAPPDLHTAMDKRIASADAAIAKLADGATILVGGFGLCGVPEYLIDAVRRKGTKNLTIASNNAGTDGAGLGLLLQNRQIKKMISTYVGENKLFEQLVLSGEVQVELNPQGTFAERIRAGGAGIPAFYTPTGYGTMVAEGKETREFDGRQYVLERGLRGDFAFIKAWKGDRWGNLIYRKTSRNFNPMMATAADYVIAEVEQLVELGQLPPDQIHTPGIFVDAIFQGPHYDKKIERRTVRKA